MFSGQKIAVGYTFSANRHSSRDRFFQQFRRFTRVAAQTLPLLPPQKVREDRYSTSRLEATYASFVLGVYCELRLDGVIGN
jgi:hypothetical protein